MLTKTVTRKIAEQRAAAEGKPVADAAKAKADEDLAKAKAAATAKAKADAANKPPA